MNKKVILTILVLLFAAGSVVFLLWNKEQSNKTVTVTPVPTKTDQQTQISPIPVLPTPTSTLDTSNWKTYTSKELGIEFKYPGDWIIISDNSSYIEFTTPKLLEDKKAEKLKKESQDPYFVSNKLIITSYNMVKDITVASSLIEHFETLEDFYGYLAKEDKTGGFYGIKVNGKFKIDDMYVYNIEEINMVNGDSIPAFSFENNKIITFSFGENVDKVRNAVISSLSFIK